MVLLVAFSLAFLFQPADSGEEWAQRRKASLKADIENLNIQYQQKLSVVFPWTSIEPSVVVAPPYSYPALMHVPTGPIAMHPSLQPYPYFLNHGPGAVSNPRSTYIHIQWNSHHHNLHRLRTFLSEGIAKANQWMTKEEVTEIVVMVLTMWRPNLSWRHLVHQQIGYILSIYIPGCNVWDAK